MCKVKCKGAFKVKYLQFGCDTPALTDVLYILLWWEADDLIEKRNLVWQLGVIPKHISGLKFYHKGNPLNRSNPEDGQEWKFVCKHHQQIDDLLNSN